MNVDDYRCSLCGQPITGGDNNNQRVWFVPANPGWCAHEDCMQAVKDFEEELGRL